MEHNVDLVLQVVGVGVDSVAAPLLDRVAHGRGARLLPWGGVKVDGLPCGLCAPRFLRGHLLPTGGGALLLGTILAMENRSSLASAFSSLASVLLFAAAAVAASLPLLLVSSLLESSWFESLPFSVNAIRDGGRRGVLDAM